MESPPLLLLEGYSAAIVAGSLLGGWLPNKVTLTHTRTQVVMSLVAGLMLGVALFHLLPHAVVQLQAQPGGASGALEHALAWLVVGLVLMLLLLRLFHFHQHDFGDPGDHPGHTHPEPGVAHGSPKSCW